MPIEPASYRFEDLKEGMEASFAVDVTPDVIRSFAALSGDGNPLHTDEAYAAQTPFHGTIAHGMICGVFFSQMVGMVLPGKYATYLSQSIKFHAPVRPGDRLIIRGKILQTVVAAQTIRLQLEALREHDQTRVTEGEAMVRLLQ